jgi:xanthine dehydrogenase YagT iron-sulfur-binding subunit
MAEDSKKPFHSKSNEVDRFSILGHPGTRREFIKRVAGTSVAIAIGPHILTPTSAGQPISSDTTVAASESVKVHLSINGKKYALDVDPRVTLLDALRERLQLTGSKKGCDHGQCGACTVLVDGRRIYSCLTLAVMKDGAQVTTIEGLATASTLHPLQQAFMKHDAFQCGYCTPGQICSAAGLIAEGKARTADEIRELMSGNICRCGAYPNIVAAIEEAMSGKGAEKPGEAGR